MLTRSGLEASSLLVLVGGLVTIRVRRLEAPAPEPLKAQDEMRGSAYPEDRAFPAGVSRLTAIPEHRRLFAAFGESTAVSDRNLGRALAAFQRTLVASNAPFDRPPSLPDSRLFCLAFVSLLQLGFLAQQQRPRGPLVVEGSGSPFPIERPSPLPE